MSRKTSFLSVLIGLCLVAVPSMAQISFCSWNIQNFGKSKPDSTVHYIAEQLRNYDVVAVIEVVAGNGGAQAVARLADELNRMGNKWAYSISDPTFSTPGRAERYAYLWKPSRVKLIGKPWLDTVIRTSFEREPYMATFEYEQKQFTIACLHALPKSKQPETELKFLKLLPERYKSLNLLICGDFNLTQEHNVFQPLKSLGYLPCLVCQRTTLKTKCDAKGCLASEYDNIFLDPNKVKVETAEVLEFQKDFKDVLIARRVSDHLPVVMRFSLR